jgi:hypothetical protein
MKKKRPTRSALMGLPTARAGLCGTVQAPTWSEHRIAQKKRTKKKIHQVGANGPAYTARGGVRHGASDDLIGT